MAAVVATALVLAATNAYLTGAAALARQLRPGSRPRALQLAVAVSGVAILGVVGAGWISLAQLVAVPTALFLIVYLFCTASAARILRGPVRIAAAVACAVTVVILGFSGAALVVVAVVVAIGLLAVRPRRAVVLNAADQSCGEVGVLLAQLALEDLAAGVLGQRVGEHDVFGRL